MELRDRNWIDARYPLGVGSWLAGIVDGEMEKLQSCRAGAISPASVMLTLVNNKCLKGKYA